MPLPPPTSARGTRPAPARPAAVVVLPLVPAGPQRPARRRPSSRRSLSRRPLPDAVAVRLLTVPDSAPPYDEGPGRRAGTPGPARRNEPLRPGPHPASSPGETGSPGAASGWPSQFAQVLAETLAGSRPQGQIAAWTTDQARKRIRQLGPMLAAQAAGAAPRVRRVVTSRPAIGVVEMTVVVGCGPRTRALAVRLERAAPHPRAPDARAPEDTNPDETNPATWICTAIESA
jgi:Family of unknown function (DUF6459)